MQKVFCDAQPNVLSYILIRCAKLGVASFL